MKKDTKITLPFIALAAIGGFFLLSVNFVLGQGVTTPPNESGELNMQLEEKKKRVEELRKQAEAYQEQINRASGDVKNLQSQIKTIDQQIAQTNFSIQAKQEEIEGLELEMDALQRSIDEKTAQMNTQKKNLTEAIKRLDESSRTSTLALVLTHDSLSEYYSQAQALASLSEALEESIETLRELKRDLQAKQDQIAGTRDEIKQSKLQLEIQRQSTVEQRSLKEEILAGAEQSEAQYNELLQQSAREEQQAAATISALERQLQDRLSNGSTAEPVFSSKGYIWPLKGGGITAYFHDPTYPFSCRVWRSSSCLEHSGVDVRAPQGTPVRATADGLVSVVHDQGFQYNAAGDKVRSVLNFVGLLHEQGISSRYLHLSTVYVRSNQFVKQGEVIGLSGGLPGTAGAGGITTGAHLHFEIREGGIPTDPLRYLP